MGLLLGEKLPKISDVGFRTVDSKKVTVFRQFFDPEFS